MNKRSHRPLTLAMACLALVALAGCKIGKDSGDVAERAGDPQTPQPEAAYHDSLASYGFDRREEFASQFTAMRAEFNAKVAELETEFNQQQLTDASRAAMAELDEARTQFEKLVSALPSVTTETWQTARDDVNRAWDRMQAAYARAKKSMEGTNSF